MSATSSDGQSTTTTVNYTVTAVPHLADVRISLAGPAGAGGGSTFTEKITVANAGPAAATNVITALGVPGGLTVTGAGGGTVSHSVVYFTAGTIPAGGSITYTITLKVAAGAHGKALLAAASASTQIRDPNYTNNAAAAIITLGANKQALRPGPASTTTPTTSAPRSPARSRSERSTDSRPFRASRAPRIPTTSHVVAKAGD